MTRAEGNLYRLTLSPPGRQTRLDRTRLEADKGAGFLAPYLYEADTDWVMRCVARRRLLEPEQKAGRRLRRRALWQTRWRRRAVGGLRVDQALDLALVDPHALRGGAAVAARDPDRLDGDLVGRLMPDFQCWHLATHGYYTTKHWRQLRAKAPRRDAGRCTVQGCGRRATHVDHIITRPRCAEPTPLDRLDNLRSLCATHDAQVKEHSHGPHGVRRGHGGRPFLKGCDVDGWPLGLRS